tara:strand:- start:11263 stop:11700 length:438 start_codon:yes stop_codon:yes gene_type:complete
MRVFTIHLRRTALSPDRDAVLIKEGFCWPAFFFGPFWALCHRMWFVFLGICAVMILMAVAEAALHVDPVSYGAVSLGISVLIGFSGNDWRRTALAARGWEMRGLSAAADTDTAFRRFLDLHPEALDNRAPAHTASPAGASHTSGF